MAEVTHDPSVPDDLRWAIEVLEAAAPPRTDDEGHYANRALTYLHRLRSRLQAQYVYAPPEKRREAYDAVSDALRELSNCWVREEVPTETRIDASIGLAVLGVCAGVPLEREMIPPEAGDVPPEL